MANFHQVLFVLLFLQVYKRKFTIFRYICAIPFLCLVLLRVPNNHQEHYAVRETDATRTNFLESSTLRCSSVLRKLQFTCGEWRKFQGDQEDPVLKQTKSISPILFFPVGIRYKDISRRTLAQTYRYKRGERSVQNSIQLFKRYSGESIRYDRRTEEMSSQESRQQSEIGISLNEIVLFHF